MTKIIKKSIMIIIFSLMILNLFVLLNNNSSKSASAQVSPQMDCAGEPPDGHWECYFEPLGSCWCACFEGGSDCCTLYDPIILC